jgi:endonuclease/exonuclease/phosphatase family metal-dependent hydrolase
MRRAFQYLRELVWIAAGLYLAAAFVAWVLHWWPATQNGALIFIAALLPWLFVGAVLIFLAAFLAKRRALKWLSFLVAVCVGVEFAPLFLPRYGETPNTKGELKVMSASVGSNASSSDEFAKRILEETPDILLLQEIAPDKAKTFVETLERESKTKLNAVTDKDIELAIVSRYRLIDVSVERKTTRLLKAKVVTPSGNVNVWNVHAFRPNFARTGLKFIAYGFGDSAQPETEKQIDWLLDEIKKVKAPLIVAGDFNAPMFSPDHRALSRVLTDSHYEAGWGLGFTFPASEAHRRRVNVFGNMFNVGSPFRLTKIDHIFHSNQFETYSARTVANNSESDHAPVVATLSVLAQLESPRAR